MKGDGAQSQLQKGLHQDLLGKRRPGEPILAEVIHDLFHFHGQQVGTLGRLVGIVVPRDARQQGLALGAALAVWHMRKDDPPPRTPALPAFVKTFDELALASIYLYHFKSVPWFGP